MPAPEFLKRFSSKGSSESPSDASTDAPPAARETPTIACPEVRQYSGLMNEAWDAANAEQPQAHGVEKFLNNIGNAQKAMTLSEGQQVVVDTLAVPAKALADTPQIADGIEKGVSMFMEAVPVVMKTLDGLANIHPFIAVAVTAFKAVYTLEMTRRGNDQKLIAIYAEMKDMMAVLIQLEGVSDPKKVAPNGQTIEGRMRGLCEDVAKDIKRCANTCNTYRNKKILVKIFSGPVWEQRLVEFVGVFTNRRKEFILALSIHTAVAVDEANVKLNVIDQRTAEIIQRMDVMTKMFQEKFVTPEQRRLTSLVKQKGGDAVIYDENAMMELWTEEMSISASAGNEMRRSAPTFDLVEIQREIQSDPTEAIEKNEESFYGKLRVQIRQIQEDVERAVRLQGDRIISAVTGGPHERIVDPGLRRIWKDMGWRGSVKARHFVLALKDHYAEMVAGGGADAASLDEWALQYININYVRNIMEAFDGDASGFITIKEANDFTCSRPVDWSLPHWLAYWAIGWQMTCTNYCKKIEEIFDGMIRLSDEVLPENRKAVNKYICDVWMEGAIFTRSIKWEGGSEELRARFQPHIDAEEERLRKNLEDVKYNFYTYDAVHLVSGNRRNETTLLPMLYLLLQRDLQKLSIARKHVLSDSELSSALDTIQLVTVMAFFRAQDLRMIFEQQGLSPTEQFATHARGLYQMMCNWADSFWGDKLREPPYSIPADSEIIPNQDSVPLGVLIHPVGQRLEIDFAAYDSPAPTAPPSVDGPDAIVGTYHGFIYQGGRPVAPMIKWTLNRGSEENSIVASVTFYQSGLRVEYTGTGTAGPLENGRMRVNLNIHCLNGWQEITMTGHFDPEENSLRGTAVWEEGDEGEFVFKHDPDFVRFYPAPSTIDARARWKYVTTVILDRIRRQSWSSSYVLKRIKDGKRYMELAVREDLSNDESDEFLSLVSSIYEADARFYTSRIKIKMSEAIIHHINCNFCNLPLEGARVICMDCYDRNTLDLCSKPECLDSVVTLQRPSDPETPPPPPHTPNHDMLKVHRILFSRDVARVEQNAKEALGAARKTISDLEAEKKPGPECVCCRSVVSLPCWYCADCTEDKFICADCEHKGLAFNDAHTKKHTLVRVIQKVGESKGSTEERLKAIEEQLGQLASVQEELSKMRTLFEKLFEKGTRGFLAEGDVGGGGCADGDGD